MRTPLDKIFDICLDRSGLDLTERKRSKNYVYYRYIYFCVSKKLTKHTLEQIGNKVGRDHATVLHGVERFIFLIHTYEDMQVWKNEYHIILELANKKLGLKFKTDHEILLETIEAKDMEIAQLREKLFSYQKILLQHGINMKKIV